MKAAVMRDGRLVVDTLPDPTPGSGQVLVKTLACGICGSDLHALKHGAKMVDIQTRAGGPFAMDLSRDVVMGHEFCAEILDHGPDSTKALKPGTRVCSMPIAFDAHGIQTVGYSNDYAGGYGERMVLNEALLLEVPNGLSTDLAALTEPMAVGLHAVQAAALQGDEVPLVLGCGPIGLAVVIALKRRNVGPVLAADFSPARRALAEKLGADVVIDPATTSPYEAWAHEGIPEGVDPRSIATMMGLGPQPKPAVIFECVGVPGLIQQILEGAPRQARVVVVGVCMERDEIEPIFGCSKELNLRFVLGYGPDEFAGTLQDIAEGRIDLSPLITGKVGLNGIPEAFEELGHPDKHAKIIAEPWR